MPWLRSGDNAATYPALLALGMVGDADDRTLNEVSGWLWRCSMQSAGHLTDGQIDAGTAQLMGGTRTQALIAAAVEAGLLTPLPGTRPPRWQLIDDPEFIHIRSRESVEFDRQRDRDRKNTDLTVPVRARDGDACRYCAQVVNFAARTGARSGTYDHTDPGQPATVSTYVVCCRGCNSAMKDGNRLELQPVPTEPYYHPATIEWLAKHGHTPTGHRSTPARPGTPTQDGHRSTPARPAPVEDTAHQRDPDTAANGATRAPQQAATPDPAPAKRSRADSWVVDEGLVPPPPGRTDQEPLAAEGGIPDGTGRVGAGQVGQGRAGPGRGGAGAPAPQGRRRRRSRGRRGAGGGGRR